VLQGRSLNHENTRWPRAEKHLVKTKQCRPSQCEADGFYGTSRNGLRAAVAI
jgi:hypothetical protein